MRKLYSLFDWSIGSLCSIHQSEADAKLALHTIMRKYNNPVSKASDFVKVRMIEAERTDDFILFLAKGTNEVTFTIFLNEVNF